MGKRRYTDAQVMWLEANANSRVWESRAEFRDAFNDTFGTSVTEYQFNNLVLYYGIKICTRQNESYFTEEQKQWLIQGAQSGFFNNCKHLTDTYNALFKECRVPANIYSYLHQWGVSLNSKYTYTDEMDSWLKDHYLSYESADDATSAFNKAFGTTRAPAAVASHCSRTLGLRRKSTRFKKGTVSKCTKPIGTISARQRGDWIKTGNDGKKSDWIRLQRFVWEQHYGKVPDGYCVIPLNGDAHDCSIENLTAIDRRATPTMAKYEWWKIDNPEIKRTAVQWCNLYCAEKDSEKKVL